MLDVEIVQLLLVCFVQNLCALVQFFDVLHATFSCLLYCSVSHMFCCCALFVLLGDF